MHSPPVHPLLNARTPQRRALILCSILIAALFQAATVNAQAQFNYLEVDGKIIEAAGPYYFIRDGDSQTAFADLHELVKATGWSVSIDPASRLVLIEHGDIRAQFEMTNDARLGLQKSPNTLRVNGAPSHRAAPSIIKSDETMYVPLLAIVEAFGGDVTWVPATHVIRVTTSKASN